MQTAGLNSTQCRFAARAVTNRTVPSGVGSRSAQIFRPAKTAHGPKIPSGRPAQQVVMQSAFDQVKEGAKNVAEKVVGKDVVDDVVGAMDPKQGEAPPMNGKTVIVTGGNAGIGHESAKAMAKAGAHVILATRNPEKGDTAVRQITDIVKESGGTGTVETMKIDLSNLKSVYDFAQEFLNRDEKLDILMNNAGEFVTEDQLTVDGLELISGTNHFGHWYLTQLLAPALKKADKARIVWTTSPSETQTPDIDFDNLEGVGKQSDLTMYGLTKLYAILSMREFTKRLGIENFAAQPGIAQTEIFGKIAAPDPGKPFASILKGAGPIVGQTAEEGARALTFAATSPDMEGHGGDVEHIVGPFYSNLPGLPYGMSNIANVGNTAQRPAKNDRAYSEEQAQRLYETTGRILSEKVKSWDSDRKWA